MPALLLFGRREVREASPLRVHTHEDAFEFVFVERGQASWEVNGSQFATGAGDVFYTRPGEPHSGNYSVIEPCQIWWLQIQAPDSDVKDHSWLGLTRQEALKLSRTFWLLPRVTHLNPDTSRLFSRLSQSLLQGDVLSQLEQRLLVLQFLFALIRGGIQQTRGSQHTAMIERVTEILKKDLARRYCVEELASTINLSPSHFHRIFRQETGLSPIAYAERLRCREACRRLENTDQTITQIATDLGYASSQHFATVFRRLTGRTPTQWRERSIGLAQEL